MGGAGRTAAPAVAPAPPDPAAPHFGAYVPDGQRDPRALDAFERAAGRRLAVVHWYQGWGVADASRWLQPAWMDAVGARGAIPLISWEPWDYTRGLAQPAFALGAILRGDHDAYVARWARAARGWGRPFFLRFAHEMNGTWYPWAEGVNGNRPGEYRAAWRRVRGLFRRAGATNVAWVWCPNTPYPGSAPLPALYPGDDAVEWVGADAYNFGTGRSGGAWQPFAAVFGPAYQQLLALAPAKPLMVAEVACAEHGGSKAAWIADAYGTQLPDAFPPVRAVLWFNGRDAPGSAPGGADWRIQSSAPARRAFAAAAAAPYYGAPPRGGRVTPPGPGPGPATR
jgi:hypothetical protein